MKRMILYTRVSTDEQADSGYSLPTQLEACRKYAHDHGFEIVGEFCDDYTGTVPIETRPEGRKAYAMLAGGEADALIAYRIDRLVRPPEEGDEWDMPILIRGLAKVGKELHVCDRGRLSTSFADLLIAMLDAKSAGDERRKFLERSKRGKRGKVRDGKPFCGGVAPYGYRIIPDDKTGRGAFFEVEESEADVVRLIYDLYTHGNGTGQPMTMVAIGHYLTEMSIPTPGEAKARTNARRKREAGMWNQSTVYFILRREDYTGTARFGQEEIPVNVPAIIGREQWQAAQARKDTSRRMSPRNNTRYQYLLRGMLSCGCGCGLTFRGHTNRIGRRYYGVRMATHPGEKGPCTRSKPSIRADMIEAAAWDYLLDVMTKHDELEAELRHAQALEELAKQPKRDELETVLEMLTEAEKEAGEIAEALKNRPEGPVKDNLKRQEADLTGKYARLARKRDQLKAEIEAQSITEKDIQLALEFQHRAKEGLRNPTWEDKRYYLEQLRFQAIIEEAQARFSCYIAVGECMFDFKSQV